MPNGRDISIPLLWSHPLINCPRKSGTVGPTIAAKEGYDDVLCPLHSSHPFGGVDAPYQIIAPTGTEGTLPWEDSDQYFMQGSRAIFFGRVSLPP